MSTQRLFILRALYKCAHVCTFVHVSGLPLPVVLRVVYLGIILR